MPLNALRNRAKSINLSPVCGYVIDINPTLITGKNLRVGIGDTVKIVSILRNQETLGMISQVSKDSFQITPFSFTEGFSVDDKIFLNESGMQIPVSNELLGRVVDPFMLPIDDKGSIKSTNMISIIQKPIEALKRDMITEPFSVGVKSIDALLTCGKGQKLGIFAGSGVGKSTLMGMIVKGSKTTIKVVALIGERGREVLEFIEKILNGNLENTIIIVATSDDSPLMRKYGAFSAISVAEYFKNQGRDVLFLMDSITRFAMAQREIGLSLGEPPTSKGYPPSSLTLLPQLMERAGKEKGKGSITAFFTILVEGDDMSDPIADQSRSILDGHIILSRELTELGVYPPIHVLNSASRVMNNLISQEHLLAALKFKKLYAILKENEMLIRIGAYTKGSDAQLDMAIKKRNDMEMFIKQQATECVDMQTSLEELLEIMKS